MRPALSPSRTPNKRIHLMSNQIASISEINGDDDENGDSEHPYVHDPGKPTNSKPLNETPNLVPHLITPTSRGSTTNLLMYNTASQPATLVFLSAALLANPTRDTEQVFPNDPHRIPPMIVGDLPINPTCSLSTWTLNGSSPYYIQTPINVVAPFLLPATRL